MTRRLRTASIARLAWRPAAAALVALGAVAAHAQRPATIVLGPATRLAEEFAAIASVRELGDGRVLISDERDKRIVVADFSANRVAPVGRLGDGPGEYRQPTLMFAFGRDTTVVPERFLRRWMLLDGDRFAGSVSPDAFPVRSTSGRILGADTLGRVVTFAYARNEFDADTVRVIRIDRSRDHVDSLARAATTRANSRSGVDGAPAEAGRGGGGATPDRRRFNVGLQTADQVVMFADGWIAIAHQRPYRVTWCAPAPATTCAAGPPIVASLPPMNDAAKRAHLAWAARAIHWPLTSDIAETVGWPDVVPAFVAHQRRLDGRSVFPAPDGRLVIERLPTADVPPLTYDVIDRRGMVSARMQLPWNHRVIGFGARSVFVIVTDDDGIERLQRHAWP